MAVSACAECGCDSAFVGPKGWSRRPCLRRAGRRREVRELIQWAARTRRISGSPSAMPAPEEDVRLPDPRWSATSTGRERRDDLRSRLHQAVRERFPSAPTFTSASRPVLSICATSGFTGISARTLWSFPIARVRPKLDEIREQTGVALKPSFRNRHAAASAPGVTGYSSSYFKIAATVDEPAKNHFVGSESRAGAATASAAQSGTSPPRARRATHQGVARPVALGISEYIELGVTRLKSRPRCRWKLVGEHVPLLPPRAGRCSGPGKRRCVRFADEWETQIRERWRLR